MDSFIEAHFVGAWGENFIIEKLLEKRLEIFRPLIDLGTDLVIRIRNYEYLDRSSQTFLLKIPYLILFLPKSIKIRRH